MVLDWQRRRSEFNHDWLKNRYLNNLDGFIANLEMKKPDETRLMRFLDEDLRQWKAKEEEARRLMDSFEKNGPGEPGMDKTDAPPPMAKQPWHKK